MTFESKGITFPIRHVKVSRDSQYSRILPVNIAIKEVLMLSENQGLLVMMP